MDGEIIGASTVARDITVNKKLEAELAARAEDLEKINKFMLGRELKMAELKNRIAELEAKIAGLEKSR
ncbi:MAG TPA: hypothetical protein P5056_02265 [Candidatus Paceibacterota bacterium]|nr:hypothetical protein [Candidatus Paceibacterota bacterium]